MDDPKIDLTKSGEVLNEVFDDDKWVKNEFARHLADDLTKLSAQLASCFSLFPELNAAANGVGTQQASLIAAFAFGVVDDVLVSTKLLVSGKLMPAGNQMRQAIEGTAVAVLCSAADLLPESVSPGARMLGLVCFVGSCPFNLTAWEMTSPNSMALDRRNRELVGDLFGLACNCPTPQPRGQAIFMDP